MKRLALILLLGSAPAFAPESAAAAAQDPGATVTGHDRVICRRVTRTASRMRIGRICRPMSQWHHEGGGNRSPDEPNARADGAADTLDALGADDISTGDQKDPMDRTPDTPLGPR